MKPFAFWQRALLGSLLLSALSPALVSCKGRSQAPLVFTVGDIRAVHADVTVSKRPVQGEQRLSDGDSVATGPDGRARLRLDDGTIVAVDAATRLTLHGSKLELEAGRVFVQGGVAARTEVTLRGASTTVASSAAAFDSQGQKATVYCAQGELMLKTSGSQLRVGSGETASLDGNSSNVAPEKAFQDWTGGLAVPWTSPVGEWRAYSTNPSSSRSPYSSSQVSARRTCGHSRIRNSRSPVRSKYAPASMTNSGVASTLP